MSIRKRKWKSTDGVEQTAWIVNYTDQAGKRRLKTFDKKKSADEFDASMRNELRTGIHTPDSSSITVSKAGDRWLVACENAGLERTTVDAYRSHLNLHITPFLGAKCEQAGDAERNDRPSVVPSQSYALASTYPLPPKSRPSSANCRENGGLFF
jgi:hypothetical protein